MNTPSPSAPDKPVDEGILAVDSTEQTCWGDVCGGLWWSVTVSEALHFDEMTCGRSSRVCSETYSHFMDGVDFGDLFLERRCVGLGLKPPL